MEELLPLISIVIVVGVTMTCSLLAVRKGKNIRLAAIAGLIFGVFALLYYLLCEPEEKLTVEWQHMICKNCDEMMEGNKNRCPTCDTKATGQTMKRAEPKHIKAIINC